MLSLLLQIATSTMSILSVYLGAGATGKVDVAAELIRIAQAANAAHLSHTGEPIRPELIKRIEPIP